jgi:hypothetical protein
MNNRNCDSLRQFVRDNNGQPIGVVTSVANFDAESIHIGWSIINRSAGDRFDKNLGVLIAENRCYNPGGKIVPRKVVKVAMKLAQRSRKYFRLENVSLAGRKVDGTLFVL